jgi:hypothetical protein
MENEENERNAENERIIKKYDEVFFSYDGNDIEKENTLDDLDFKDTVENVEIAQNSKIENVSNEMQIKMENKNSENEKELEPDSTEKKRRNSFFFPINSDTKKEKKKTEKDKNIRDDPKADQKDILPSFIYLKFNPPQLNEEISR